MTQEFSQWFPLLDLAIAHLPKYGKFPAVYSMRNSATKEILKYGCTKNLRQRIICNYLGGVGGSTTKRIHIDLFDKTMINKVEISWIEAENSTQAKTMEQTFRRTYKSNYGKLPAWDLID